MFWKYFENSENFSVTLLKTTQAVTNTTFLQKLLIGQFVSHFAIATCTSELCSQLAFINFTSWWQRGLICGKKSIFLMILSPNMMRQSCCYKAIKLLFSLFQSFRPRFDETTDSVMSRHLWCCLTKLISPLILSRHNWNVIIPFV